MVCHLARSHDELVQLADAVMRIGSFIDTTAAFALLAPLGAVVLNVALQVLTRHLVQITNVASNRLEWTLLKMGFQITGLERHHFA